jgi:hypothetical protein
MSKSLHLNNQPLIIGQVYRGGDGCVFWRGGSQEVARPFVMVQLKMQNACIFCNVRKQIIKKNQDRKRRAFSSFEASNDIGTIV